MHELSIATSMVEMAAEEAERQGGVRVLAVHLRLGPLSGVVKEALLFAWEVACDDTPLAGSRLVIEESPVVVRCPSCREERELATMQDRSCPVCRVPAPDVVRGDELLVVALEVQ